MYGGQLFQLGPSLNRQVAFLQVTILKRVVPRVVPRPVVLGFQQKGFAQASFYSFPFWNVSPPPPGAKSYRRNPLKSAGK